MESIGEKIKASRTDKNLTQKKLSELTGLSEISIRKYESGERNPKFDALEKISGVLNVQIDYLLGRTKLKKFDNQIMYDDILHLIEKTEGSDKSVAKLVSNIVDTMFLTIFHSTVENNIAELTIIHDLYRNIYNIKIANEHNLISNLLEIDIDPPNNKYEEKQQQIIILLDELHNLKNNNFSLQENKE